MALIEYWFLFSILFFITLINFLEFFYYFHFALNGDPTLIGLLHLCYYRIIKLFCSIDHIDGPIGLIVVLFSLFPFLNGGVRINLYINTSIKITGYDLLRRTNTSIRYGGNLINGFWAIVVFVSNFMCIYNTYKFIILNFVCNLYKLT